MWGREKWYHEKISTVHTSTWSHELTQGCLMKSLGNKHEVIMTCELLCYWVEYLWKSQSKYKVPMNIINSLIGILR